VGSEFNRWSQIVRGPGAVTITGHHPVQVPALGDDPLAMDGRPGVRLLTLPLDDSPPIYSIDITSTAAIAMLEGFLSTGAHVGKRLTWRSGGTGRFRRDTIHLKPLI